MNALEAYRKANELTFEALATKAGRKKPLIWKHCHTARIPADAVPGYEARLGIPRWMMRPDLWDAPKVATALPPPLSTANTEEARG